MGGPCTLRPTSSQLLHALSLNSLPAAVPPHPRTPPLPPQIADDFIAAHPGRKIPKKWALDALKDHADWTGAKQGWVLRPSGQALAQGTAAAAPGAAPTPGGGAAAAAPAEAATGGVEPTPVAGSMPTTEAGNIERFLQKRVGGGALCGTDSAAWRRNDATKTCFQLSC